MTPLEEKAVEQMTSEQVVDDALDCDGCGAVGGPDGWYCGPRQQSDGLPYPVLCPACQKTKLPAVECAFEELEEAAQLLADEATEGGSDDA